MTDPGGVSRGEFDMLKAVVSDYSSRMTSIDDHGSRGVGVVQQQVTDVIKDLMDVKAGMAALKTDIDQRFDAHAKAHRDEAADRVRGRRWLITTGITVALALLGMFTSIMILLIGGHHVR